MFPGDENMKRFILTHIGFEMPTPEIKEKKKKWFDSIEDVTVQNIGLGPAREVSADGDCGRRLEYAIHEPPRPRDWR